MEYNPMLFQEEMRRLIGARTLGEFAALCDLSRTNLSRLMGEHSYQPSKKTLRKIADNAGGDYEHLLTICGYAASPSDARRQRPFDERVRMNAADMEKGFSELAGKVKLYKSVEEFMELYEMLYSCESCRHILGRKCEYEGDLHPEAEYYTTVSVTFKDRDNGTCTTYAVIYFAETKGGRVLILDTALDARSIMEVGFLTGDAMKKMGYDPSDAENLEYVCYTKETDEMRLLKAIFGEPQDDSERYPVSEVGFGFEIGGVPKHFDRFLEAHKESVRDGEEKKDIEAYLNSRTRDPEKDFEYVMDKTTYESGCATVIALIMSEETGMPFTHFASDDGKEVRHCVMVLNALDAYSEEELKAVVRKYAKELGLREYGECVVTTYRYEEKSLKFKVDDEEESE